MSISLPNFQKPNYLRVIIVLIVLLSLTFMPLPVPVFARGRGCSTSTSPSAAYTVTVCIVAPTAEAILTGNIAVKANVRVTGISPGVQKLVFYLGGQYLLTDYATAYTFILPTTKFVDGIRTLEVKAIMRDGFTSTRVAINVTFNNGITEPPVNTNTYAIATGTTPAPGRPFILAATGDGASGEPRADAVADMIAGWNPNMFLYLGDVYDDGTFTEFYNWYGSGADHYSGFRAVTNPTVGNHEYEGGQAPGYFDYWDNVPDYYSFDVAGWHVISLNSTGQFGQTVPGTTQYDWLVTDLNANTAVCTIAYFHHPVYNIGPNGDAPRMKRIWAFMAQHGVDVVLTGHDHDYQRWHPLNGQGNLDPNGITQFVVGTGGHGIQDSIRTDRRVAIGFDTPPTAFGALRMELNQDGAAFQFVNTKGSILDSGSIPCSGAAPDTTPPEMPTHLTAISSTATHIDLSWTSATDNVGVTDYDIYRDGVWLATAGPVTSYTDKTVIGGTTYQYQIRARDAAGKASRLNGATVTATKLIFHDDFENGNFSQWTGITGLAIQKQHVYTGYYAVRGASRGTAMHAYKQLSQTESELYYRLWFKILSQGTNTVYLQRFRTPSNGAILGVFVSRTGRLGFRNDVTGISTTSSTIVTPHTWHELQTRVRINGSMSEIEIWLNGARISSLSKTENLGITAVGRIQLGDNARGRLYDIALDRVALSTQFIDFFDPPEETLLSTSTSTPPLLQGQFSEWYLYRRFQAWWHSEKHSDSASIQIRQFRGAL